MDNDRTHVGRQQVVPRPTCPPLFPQLASPLWPNLSGLTFSWPVFCTFPLLLQLLFVGKVFFISAKFPLIPYNSLFCFCKFLEEPLILLSLLLLWISSIGSFCLFSFCKLLQYNPSFNWFEFCNFSPLIMIVIHFSLSHSMFPILVMDLPKLLHAFLPSVKPKFDQDLCTITVKGQSHEEKLLFFWILSKRGGVGGGMGVPYPFFWHLFIKFIFGQ